MVANLAPVGTSCMAWQLCQLLNYNITDTILLYYTILRPDICFYLNSSCFCGVWCTGNTEWSVLDSVRGGAREDWSSQAGSEEAPEPGRWAGMGELGECFFLLGCLLSQTFWNSTSRLLKELGNLGQCFSCCLMMRGSRSISGHSMGPLSHRHVLRVDYQRLVFTLWTIDVREDGRGCENQHVFVLQRDSQNQYGGAWPTYLTSPPSEFIVNLSYLQPSFEMWPPMLL